MQSYVPDEFLASAIARLDQQGYNVINFDEFAFLPVNGDYVPDINGMQPLKYYYFYEPLEISFTCGFGERHRDSRTSQERAI